ncbi:MAG: site-specific integrase [Candidatus Brocadiales bacterium]|nr:site-specific integrase [Candidatus Brocadiales bacterium]
MLEAYFKNPNILSRLEDKSLGPGIPYLAEYLSKQGYSIRTITDYLRAAAHFNYWIRSEHIPLHNIHEKTVDKFLYEHFKECHCAIAKGGPIRQSRPATRQFLNVLRMHDVVDLPEKPVSISPIDKLLDDFGKHMEKVHGATLSTIHSYSMHIRTFIKAKYQDEPIEFKRLCVEDVREYVITRAGGYKPKTVKSLATSLRAFFRFLRMTNQIEHPLEDVVPTVPHWKLSTLPKYLTEKQLQCLLSSFTVSTPIGLRDRAMTLLMSGIGFRAYEVAHLSLDEIDWKQGIIELKKSKSRHASYMPLPAEVGEALAMYLQKGRPYTKERYIFVSHASPKGRPLSPSAVRIAIRRAFKRCALSVPSYGTHVLRHTLATRLLQKGARLKEIADLLRHQSIETTNIYAKVDLRGLAQVALPWPEVMP